MFKSIRAKDIMTASVVSLSPTQTLRDAWRVFSEKKLTGAPVISEDGKLVGVLSQTDLVREAFGDELEGFSLDSYLMDHPYWDGDSLSTRLDNLAVTPIEEAMNPYPITAHIDDPVPVLATAIRSHKIHRILIVDSHRKVLGIVTTADLVRLLEEQ